jgi:hypothetical protein
MHLTRKPSIGVLVLPTLYFGLCAAVALGLTPSEGSWGWFVPFLAAFPFSILLLPIMRVVPPFLAFGVFGTLWWYGISIGIASLIRRLTAGRRRP